MKTSLVFMTIISNGDTGFGGIAGVVTDGYWYFQLKQVLSSLDVRSQGLGVAGQLQRAALEC